MASNIVTKRLIEADRAALIAHFRMLSPTSRYLRFGTGIRDEALARYVERIDFDRDALYGVHESDLSLVGVAHIAITDASAELGVSVLETHRKQGIGAALFERASIWARNHGVTVLYTHCLVENAEMMRIARKSGMDVVTIGGEADAHLKLSPSNFGTIAAELLQDRVALYDYALKSYVMRYSS